MSIIYCERHDLKWDSDFKDECPACENDAMTSLTDIKNTEAETGWKPTAYLRYVWISVKTLQQLWINSDGRDEWRDVPFVE